jgi:hypothetical protein
MQCAARSFLARVLFGFSIEIVCHDVSFRNVFSDKRCEHFSRIALVLCFDFRGRKNRINPDFIFWHFVSFLLAPILFVGEHCTQRLRNGFRAWKGPVCLKHENLALLYAVAHSYLFHARPS